MTTLLFVRHQVGNYDQWRRAYDDVGPVRSQYGVTGDEVFRGPEDRNDINDITVVHQFADLPSAQRFAESEELAAAMATAGVLGEPTTWFADPAKR